MSQYKIAPTDIVTYYSKNCNNIVEVVADLERLENRFIFNTLSYHCAELNDGFIYIKRSTIDSELIHALLDIVK